MNKIIEGVCVCERCKKEFSWRCPNPFYKEFNSINWSKDILNAKNWRKEPYRKSATIELICPSCETRNFTESSVNENSPN